MAKANAQGNFGIIRALAFEDGTKTEAPFAWFNTLEIAERVLSDRIDAIGLFEDFRMEGRPLASIEFYVSDADGKRVEGSRRSFWDADLDERLFEVLSEVRRDGQTVESASRFRGSDYAQAASVLDSLDLEASYLSHGGYGAGVEVCAVLVDSSPLVSGGSPLCDLTRRFDDAAYERKLAAVGQAVHDGILERAEISELYRATDSEISFAEEVYDRPAGRLSAMLAEAPGEDAPIQRNAEARELSMLQGSTAKRDATIRR